jgi:rhodanese-related sulfurtransferase
VVVLSYPQRIEAGFAGSLDLCVAPEQPGRFEYTVAVEPADGARPAFHYVLRGRVNAALESGESAHWLPGIAPRLLTRALHKRDRSCYVEAAAVRGEPPSDPPLTFVDIRPAQDFARVHIPGSLNIPLFAVKAKPFLRGRRVVLVDQGHGRTELEQECAVLRGRGFESVAILRGGLAAWVRQGGALTGSPAAVGRLALIAPGEFHAVRDADDWLLLAVDPVPPTGFAGLMPGCQHVPFAGRSGEFAAEVASRLGARDAPSRVLIGNHDGRDYEAVLACQPQAAGACFFALEGGFRAWERYLRELSAAGAAGSERADGMAGARGARRCGVCGVARVRSHPDGWR